LKPNYVELWLDRKIELILEDKFHHHQNK